jgi:hypothetical protein
VPPSAFNPLASLDRDYGQAVVHLAWDFHRGTRDRTLLCGAVELVPHEVPPPLDRPERRTEISREHFVFTTSRALSAQMGLDWFEAAAGGCVVRPNPDETFAPTAANSPTFVTSGFDSEPIAPHLVTTSLLVPFSADWQTCPRVRHILPRDFLVTRLWSKDEFKRASDWLSEEMHFPWDAFPEYWGSIHLIAANPVFRSLHSRIDRASGLAMLIALQLYRGQSIEGLEFEFESRRPTGTAYVLRKRLDDPITRIELPGEPEAMFERVHDPKRGLLYSVGPFWCNEALSLTMNVVTETRSVRIPRSEGGDDGYEVPLVGPFSIARQVGEPRRDRVGAERLSAASSDRERRNRGIVEQKWFRDQVEDAIAELRALVGGATAPLLLVDPYFGGDDLRRVLLAVQDPGLLIVILVGANHLRERHPTLPVEECDHLDSCLAQAQAAGPMNPMHVRVMSGSSRSIHDRLLLVDDRLWMLGSSLNAYGRRGTLLVRVPDPEPVLADVREVWSSSEDFSAWSGKRRKDREKK